MVSRFFEAMCVEGMNLSFFNSYLLSPQTSLIGGLGSPTAKFTLLGSKNPANVMKDTDALIFSEILEFALSLVPVVKGQEPFHGIPHLQAYRFVRSVMLAELGEVQLANRYDYTLPFDVY